ncbi:MAG: trypsin-like peptidase domain-containing protein [Patescibacteria group bacterium]
MDLEQLTKHQIILLTLLVSFVTSIATGIVTVSLMDQAPPGITRVVNQIVEHTIEKVVPATQGAAAITTTEKTVVVKDDDLTAQSIGSVQKAIIRITAVGGKDLVARGVITSAQGTALTDAAALAGSKAESFEAILASGERVPVTKVTTSTTSPIAILTLGIGTSTGFAPATLGSGSNLRLGQSIIRIGGVGSDTVGNGVIASLPRAEDGSQKEIQASVSAITPGSIIITLFGEVIGLSTGDSSLTGSDFYSIPNVSKGAEAPGAVKAGDTSVHS